MPTTDPDNNEKKIGIKVKEEAKDKLDPKYLFYVFMNLKECANICYFLSLCFQKIVKRIINLLLWKKFNVSK